MSIFNTILEKLGIQKPAASAATAAPSTSAPSTAPMNKGSYAPPGLTAAPQSPAAIPVVDVMSKLEKMAGSNSGLDWKVSIVDMLKLLGMDSSLNARKELATELGCPADLMGGDYAKMNVWLHQTVLQKIAENGGNIPKNLLH